MHFIFTFSCVLTHVYEVYLYSYHILHTSCVKEDAESAGMHFDAKHCAHIHITYIYCALCLYCTVYTVLYISNAEHYAHIYLDAAGRWCLSLANFYN